MKTTYEFRRHWRECAEHDPKKPVMMMTYDGVIRMLDDITELERKLATAVSALEFYAKQVNWSEVYYEADDCLGWDGDVGQLIDIEDISNDKKDPNFGCGGSTARTALAAVRDSEGG